MSTALLTHNQKVVDYATERATATAIRHCKPIIQDLGAQKEKVNYLKVANEKLKAELLVRDNELKSHEMWRANVKNALCGHYDVHISDDPGTAKKKRKVSSMSLAKANKLILDISDKPKRKKGVKAPPDLMNRANNRKFMCQQLSKCGRLIDAATAPLPPAPAAPAVPVQDDAAPEAKDNTLEILEQQAAQLFRNVEAQEKGASPSRPPKRRVK